MRAANAPPASDKFQFLSDKALTACIKRLGDLFALSTTTQSGHGQHLLSTVKGMTLGTLDAVCLICLDLHHLNVAGHEVPCLNLKPRAIGVRWRKAACGATCGVPLVSKLVVANSGLSRFARNSWDG